VFDAGALMRDTERLLKPLLGEKITLTVHAAARDAPVRMDPGQLEQVLINLAVNARDAMPRGGTLRLETDTVTPDGLAAAPPVPHVRVRVTDTGVGMPPDVQARVFEPFFTTKGTAEGTGLGLAVCHGIVEQAGGRISVASTPGAGTTVTILLPHAAEEVEHPPPARESAARGTETVLLAEDEAAVREPLAQVLRALGYTVLTASDGEEAVRVARRVRRVLDGAGPAA
jgi:signal transduction histidine kinase